MRIALVILHADPARGGAERYTVDLASGLVRRGHEVSLLAASFALQVDGVRQQSLASAGASRVGRYRRFLDSLDAHLDTERYDIVHAMLPVRRCDVYHPHAGLARAQARRTGLRMIFAPRRWAMARVERQLLEGARPPVVLSLSDYVKRDIQRHYPRLPGDRLATLFNAVDLDRFQPMPSSGAIRSLMHRNGVVGLFIGKDYVRKGLAEAVTAMGKLGEPALVLAVVGSEDWRRYGLKTPVGVSIIALAAAPDPRPYYADADFFILPTKDDPCSLVVLEALAMGLPVISTKFNGATEIMTDGLHGYVLDNPRDIDALAEAMRKMMDEGRRQEMRKACLALRSALSYEQHLDRLEGIYAQRMALHSP